MWRLHCKKTQWGHLISSVSSVYLYGSALMRCAVRAWISTGGGLPAWRGLRRCRVGAGRAAAAAAVRRATSRRPSPTRWLLAVDVCPLLPQDELKSSGEGAEGRTAGWDDALCRRNGVHNNREEAYEWVSEWMNEWIHLHLVFFWQFIAS